MAVLQAECLQSWADLQREVLQQAADDVWAQPGHVQQVQQTVLEAYRAALEAYKQVETGSWCRIGSKQHAVVPAVAGHVV